MQRTFNYTGRKKITQEEALFSFSGTDEAPSFNVEFSINEKDFPEEATLYVEAYYKETKQRFDFGKISKIVPPSNRNLSEIDLSGPTLFRVLIVDERNRHGLLLASGDQFRADTDDKNDQDRSSLLAVVKKPLGQTTWKVEFDTGGIPELCLNSIIPNALEKMRSDPQFQSLILPAAMKQILTYFVWADVDGEDEVAGKWLEFAKCFGEEKPDSQDPSDLIDWIDEVVAAFSQKFNLCDRLVDAMVED